jgi:N-methylhydantoinase B
VTTSSEHTWDGVRDCYIPAEKLTIDPQLRLHTDAAAVDPFLFEVIRHNLWNINDEHGMTVIKVSGSPIAYSAEDMATAVMTERGEFVYVGSQNQLLAGFLDLQAKWILENRSGGAGIRDGDMFLGNDPWVGATHQQDVSLLCPVFWEGELFCWVGCGLHQYDLGGSTPGGFCPDATDCFMEPVSIPPIKMVENNELRPDMEDFYLRHSRMPELVALDLRAQLSGNLVARDRILKLIARYGADVVKGSMYKVIDDAERVFASRLERLPDGIFRARSYLEASQDGDRTLYPICMQVEKKGARLIFSMEGTAPQTGALNAVFAGWRCGIISSVELGLCHDLLYSIGGPLRRMDLRPEPGTICCASHPASVSNTHGPSPMAGALAAACLAKLLAFDEELKHEVVAPGGCSTFLVDSLSGTNQWGAPFGTVLLDPMLGGTGAFTFRDGIDTGGCWWSPRSVAPNVEDHEQAYPILYLYRREWVDSGGAGRFRGGNSGRSAFVAHGTDAIEHSSSSPGMATPISDGVFGGSAASPSNFRLVTGSGIQQSFADRRIPAEFDELEGEQHVVRPKQRSFMQTPDDVIELAWSAGGGIGDPLERDPAIVAEDVRGGKVSAAWAEQAYGVVVTGPGVDADATASRRAEIRKSRLAGAPRSVRSADKAENDGRLWMWDVLVAVSRGAGRTEFHCAACETVLSDGEPGSSYKDGTVLVERPLVDRISHTERVAELVDEPVVVREFSCPGCARLLSVELARPGDEILKDIELRLAHPQAAGAGAGHTERGA